MVVFLKKCSIIVILFIIVLNTGNWNYGVQMSLKDKENIIQKLYSNPNQDHPDEPSYDSSHDTSYDSSFDNTQEDLIDLSINEDE